MRPCAVGLLLVLIVSPGEAQQDASVVTRVQQLVNAGNRAGARSYADSVLSQAPLGSPAYSEALFARAFASADAAAAERDYARLVLEFPQSPRMEEALLASGQFRMARGDRAGARRQFERLTLEFPNGAQTLRAALWAGRLALESGDVAAGCSQLAIAYDRAGEDVEFRNQVEYLRTRCRLPRAGAAPDSVAGDTARAALREVPSVRPREYSVQVAAFARRRDADALARRLSQRGFQVRIAGEGAPYRVRVGRYATQELAIAAAARMKRSRVNGIVVEAEPR
jgi:hypothetical protein